jgi:mono/diheme cytochrome c family protein
MIRHYSIRPIGGLATLLTVVACVGGGNTAGDKGAVTDTGHVGQEGQRGQASRSGIGGMMGGRGGGMMVGMMGNAPRDTAAAPQAKVATASAAGCPATSQALVNAGRGIFTGSGNCYACHSSNAKGTPAAPNLTDATWLDIDGSYGGISQLVRQGVAHPKKFPEVMPAKGGAALDSLQVCAVAAYVYSLGH